ncbi:MAG: WS/DGAT domain-containing protein [Actinomycetota bacterium]|nr:WS/DGAT domain-containing protein [Actinomycetota bacterium]
MAEDVRFEKRMSDSDALMWGIEKDPLLRSTITSVSIFDRAPDGDRVIDKLDRGSRLIPRLRQRVVSAPFSPAPPRWIIDPNFDLRYHLRFATAPGDGSLRALLDFVEPLAMQGFDRARPLWEFTVVDGLADGRAAMVQKIHHAITDGVGAVRLAMVLLDLERDPPDDTSPMPDAPEPDEPGWLERIVGSARHEQRRNFGIARRSVLNVARLVGDPVGAGRQGAANVTSIGRLLAPAFEPMSPIMGGRSLSMRFDPMVVPLGELKAAARRVEGGKLNDAFVAGVAGGLRRYHEAHGTPVESLRMTMPINVRTGETAALAGNQFVPARFAVPVGLADPVDRIRAVQGLVVQQRAEPSLGFVEGISGILTRLPTTVATGVFGRMLKGIDFVTSNVPGSPIPVFLAGGRLEAQFAFGPLSGSAANVTLLSYLDECQLGVNTDPAAVPDPERFLSCLEEGFDEVRKIA